MEKQLLHKRTFIQTVYRIKLKKNLLFNLMDLSS